MVGFVLVWGTMVVALGALFAFICAGTYVFIIQPLLTWLPGSSKKKGGKVIGFFVDVANILPRAIANKVERFTKEHVALLLRTYVNGIDPLVVFVLQLDVLATRIAGTLADQSEQIYEALRILRRVTIPQLITQALTPIRAQLGRHTERLDALEDLNRRAATVYGDVLRALPWGVPGTLIGNLDAFGARFVQLWRHYWDVTRDQLRVLLDETIPELRRDVADLARRLDVQIDERFDALGRRLTAVERAVEQLIPDRLAALEAGLDALAREVFGEVGTGLVALIQRVVELERLVQDTIAVRLAELEAGLAQLRFDMEEGIRTGLGVFAERLEAVELAIGTLIPSQIEALRLAVDALAAEIFGEVGEGLAALTARIVALEQYVFGELREQIDLQLGRIEGIEARIRDVILPRLDELEALLAPAAFAALVLATMRRVAPNLFCRNVTRTTEALCAADPGLIDDLLALLLPALVLADLCTFARMMREAAGPLVGLLSPIVLGAADMVECRGAGEPPNLPLRTTALPQPTAALAL